MNFQGRVLTWITAAFSDEIVFSQKERSYRFLEESLELVQALGFSAHEAHQMVDYVFNRPAGKPTQEVGGVLICLAALCCATDIDMDAAGKAELKRAWEKISEIQVKHANKPDAVKGFP